MLLLQRNCATDSVAQLDRAPDYGSGGWGFESLRSRSKGAALKWSGSFFVMVCSPRPIELNPDSSIEKSKTFHTRNDQQFQAILVKAKM